MTSWRQHIMRQQYGLSKQLQDGFQNLVRSAVAMNVCLLLLCLVTAYVIVTVEVTRSLTEEAKDKAYHMVEVMATAIEAFVPPGTAIGPEMDSAVQESIIRMIHSITYDDPNGYFILFGMDGLTIAQGVDQGFEGTNRRYATDADGIHHILLLSEAAKRGGGFVRYKWKKRDGGKPSYKISYVKLLRGGQWWIATGVYLDSVDEVIGDILNTQGLYLLVLAGVLFLFLSAGYHFGNVLGHKFAQPVVEQMKGFARMADEERGFLAMELHNLVGRVSVLLTTKFSDIAHARNVTTRQVFEQRVSEVIEHLDGGSQDLRRKLFPLEVQRDGIEALRQLVKKETKGRATLQVDLVMDKEVARSDNGRERALYLIAQGLLQNVLIHAEASRVCMTLVWQGATVTLTVTDNGKGFAMDTVRQRATSKEIRYGLRWMETQVEVYGGCITFDSSLGQGTNVRVTMPWPPPEIEKGS